MDALMSSITILTTISAVLLAILMIIYIRNLGKFKSGLLTGLLIFTALFFIQNIVSLYYYITMMNYYVPAVKIHVFIFSLLQTIAFAIMLWITWE
jgi:hypothetical protein